MLADTKVLPIAVPYGRLTLSHEPPEQLARGQGRGPLDDLAQILAVERKVRVGLSARHGQQGRGPVHGDGDLRRHHAARTAGRVANDSRNPNAALQQVAFFAHERPHAGKTLAAVVAGEDHDRVIRNAGSVQGSQDTAYTVVHRAHHFRIGRQRAAAEVEQFLQLRGPGGIDGALPRPMWRGIMEAQKEGAPRLRRVVHILHRTVGQQIGEVSGLLDQRFVLVKIGPPAAVLMGEIVSAAARHAEELIVAALEGPEPRKVAHVPLADEAGRIPAPLQKGCKCWV